MRALAVLVACLGLGAAPVPRERPVSEVELCGVWAYSWNGAPGVMWLDASGAYLAQHGYAEEPNYAGVWWCDGRGRLVVIEYRACGERGQLAPPNRFDFEAVRVPNGYALRNGFGTVVRLIHTNGGRQ